MGKETRIVYICDICGSEFEREINTCPTCKKDYCGKCGIKFSLIGNKEYIDRVDHFLNITKFLCIECGEKIAVSVNEEQVGDYKIVFSD